MDTNKFITDLHDHLSQKLDVYEQAIYFYLVRHSRLLGKNEIVVGFKSARNQLPCGIGKSGSAPSERVCYVKTKSLEENGCIKIIGSEHQGTRYKVFLPHEIDGIIPIIKTKSSQTIEEMDFFNDKNNRKFILVREAYKCFYCFAALNERNYVLEHVISRPEGDNSYRNLVASCRQCNNKKGSSEVTDYLRTLYREGFLNNKEFEGRLSHLELLQAGRLKPSI